MTISDYRNAIVSHAPCEEGLKAFEQCRNRKALFELIGSPLGCDYFLKSIQDGWGPTKADFLSIFLPYVNGSYTIRFDADGRMIRSQIWSGVSYVEIDDSVRWLILIGCEGRVRIKPFQVVKIFVDASSNVQIEAGENSIVYVKNYGGYVADINKACKIV
jgi:hypothetical protein